MIQFIDSVGSTVCAAWLVSWRVLAARTVVDLVAGSGIEFTDRGPPSLKAVAGEWQLHAVKG
jgi:hypothetical protein